MSKKIITFFVVAALAASLTACGAQQTEEAEKPAESISQTQDAEQTTEDNQNPIDVDKNLTTVELTIPKDLFMGETPSTELTEEQKADGFISATLNADGSVTYKVKKSRYNDIVKETKESTIESLNEIATSGDYPSIKKVDFNDDFSKITLYANKTEYENSFDSMACFSAAFSAGFYQAIANKTSKCDVFLVDMETNEVLDSYPAE